MLCIGGEISGLCVEGFHPILDFGFFAALLILLASLFTLFIPNESRIRRILASVFVLYSLLIVIFKLFIVSLPTKDIFYYLFKIFYPFYPLN